MHKLSAMWTQIVTHWPHILAVASTLIATVAAAHAAMTKDEVRAAIGWVGVILLSPFIGALLYAVAGINRIRRVSIAAERSAAGHEVLEHPRFDATSDAVASRFGRRFAALKIAGDRITHHALTTANAITKLDTGDQAYGAMIAAISAARRSVVLETYIFDRDPIGLRIADALIDAARRGVAVRVLIDAVGARYSVPSIVGHLSEGGVTTRSVQFEVQTNLPPAAEQAVEVLQQRVDIQVARQQMRIDALNQRYDQNPPPFVQRTLNRMVQTQIRMQNMVARRMVMLQRLFSRRGFR